MASEPSQLLVHHELGGSGPEVLLMMHACGYHGRMFQPMVSVLGSRFRCIALDLPGHAASSHVLMPPGWKPEDPVEMVRTKLQQLGLEKGLYCFGLSWGGTVAVTLETQHPGTFKALYVYEPILIPKTMREEWLNIPGKHPSPPLAPMALKRRTHFDSHQDALQTLRTKPPFSLFTKEVMQLYVQHGLRSSQGGEGVELCCDPKVEADIYLVNEPPLAPDYAKVRCPTVLAVGKFMPKVHERLVIIGPQVQKEIPGSKLERFELSHLGPYQNPQLVAKSVLAHFQASRSAGTQLQLHPSKL